jgi:UDP-glucose 4-epimerase
MLSLSGKRVLITGASGFIGNVLCERLAQRGAEIHAVSRFPQREALNKIRWWQGDLSRQSDAEMICLSASPDFIFHLAGHPVAKRGLDQVWPTFSSNCLTALNILSQSVQRRCRRIVIAGSLEEPDSCDGYASPSSPYAASKWVSSTYARMFHQLYQLPVVIGRIFMTYGPRQQDFNKLIPYTIMCLLRGEAPQISSGNRPVDWIYVDDLADGLIRLAEAEGAEGATIDLGSGSLVSIRDVVSRLCRIVGTGLQPLYGARPERPMEQVRVANVRDTWERIYWKPRTQLENGLCQTVAWYKQYLSQAEGGIPSPDLAPNECSTT